ncbi:hypothetical protein IBE10_07385 [Francisella tularensis subsp. novicida]|uniref:hypothetical protein n=1 Tax=Francisella tularensis TaxID=263 RepID=UPI0008FD8948|nr:hypothetical protein [Francisella tularensis]APC94561.1 putative lipoprotein [Francisella tularensis subsp. novicida]MBK2346741.1 hypothetical protein [Francisella tularensis subsp. novicida]
MKLRKLFIGLVLLIPTLAYCGLWDYVIGNRLKMNEMKNFAKNYAEQKYHRDYEVKALDWNNKNSGGVLLKPTDDSSGACWIWLVRKDGDYTLAEQSTVGAYPDFCRQKIIERKMQNYLEENIVSKYFKNAEVFSFNFSCADEEKSCGLPKGDSIYNYWNLSSEEWLKKFYKYLQVDGVYINIFEVKRSPENIVKIMKMVKSLNKELYKITSTHIIWALTLKAYESSAEAVRKEQKDVWSHKYSYWFLYSETNCKARRLKANNLCGNDLVNLNKMNIQELLDFSSKFTHLVSVDKRKRELLKDTKYYSQVKNILANQR